jgi:hypothetical protein
MQEIIVATAGSKAGGGQWVKAYFADDPAKWGIGSSAPEAIGKLVLAWAEDVQVHVIDQRQREPVKWWQHAIAADQS